jgi:L-rhamnose mutarotase
MKDHLKIQNYSTFKRYCKFLKLQDDPVLIEKYKQIHGPGMVWPEIKQGMREVGILDMEIYIHDNYAFMIMETVPDFDHGRAMKELASKPRQNEWESFVSQFQQAGARSDTPEKCEVMQRIFLLD